MEQKQLDIIELIRSLVKGYKLILFITTIFGIGSVIYSLSLDNIYKSQAILSPLDSTQNLDQSRAGAFANLTGVQFGDSANKSLALVAKEVVKTPEFFSNFYENDFLLAQLIAVKGYSPEKRQLIYDKNIFNIEEKEWAQGFSKPNLLEVHGNFINRIEFIKNKNTKFFEISFEHMSPISAKEWLDLIIRDLGEYMKKREVEKAKASLNYLQNQITSTKIPEIRNIFSEVIKTHIQTIMLAEIHENIVFETIQSPYQPIYKDRPSRSFICIFITIFGFFVSVLIVLVKNYVLSNTESLKYIFSKK